MCRTGTSGCEGMPQDHGRGRRVDRGAGVGAMLWRAAIGVAFIGLVVGLDTSTARAADDDTNASAWSKFMQTLGLKKGPNDPDIDLTERSPLVVPPSRDLPPPVADAAAPTPDWPKDPKVKPHKHHKANVVPAGTEWHGNRADGPASALPEEGLVQPCNLVQPGRIRDVYRRAGARQPDGSAVRLPHAVAGSSLRHRPGKEGEAENRDRRTGRSCACGGAAGDATGGPATRDACGGAASDASGDPTGESDREVAATGRRSGGTRSVFA